MGQRFGSKWLMDWLSVLLAFTIVFLPVILSSIYLLWK